MEEWKEYKLGDVSDITKLAGFEFTKYVKYNPDGEIIAVRALNLRDGHLDLKDIQRIDKETSNALLRSKLYKGDIVLSYTGTIGACAIITENEKYHLAPNVCKIKPYDSIEPFFLYYIIRSRDFQESLVGYAHGSTQPTIPMKTIREIPVKICSKEKQLKIASILKSLDDKIEVNRKINENLEQQAQALFKSWFVDFEPFKKGEFVESELGKIPKGWRVGTLNEIADITMGTSPSGTSYNTEGQGDVFYQGRAEFGFRFPQRNLYTTEAKRFAEVDSILVSVRAPVGDINVAEERCCIGRGLASVKSKSNCDSYILYLMQSLKPVFDRFNGEGTVFGSINKKAFENIKIVIPTEKDVSVFNAIVNSMDGKIKNMEKESRRLAELRDTLLPKLMSGELKVNEINI